MKETIVKNIKFDFTYNGVEYKGVNSGYDESDNIDMDYIHSYDGPWFMLEFGNDVLDFQIYGEEDGRLQIDALKCKIGEDGFCYDKDYLVRGKDYTIENIKVDYVTKHIN